jgi:NlpC/P60 family
VQGVSGPAVLAAGAGVVLIWSGVKGASVTGALRSLLSGRAPSGAEVYPLGAPGAVAGSASVVGSASGSAIAQDGLSYVGRPYLWEGASPSGFDCSGLVNWVLGHDLGLPIPGEPGGGFTGASHGPDTLVWLAWPGKTHLSRGQVQAGDLVIWQSHMGIAINGSQYVSAYDSAEGVVVHSIDGGGPPGELATYWQLDAAAQPGAGHKERWLGK